MSVLLQTRNRYIRMSRGRQLLLCFAILLPTLRGDDHASLWSLPEGEYSMQERRYLLYDVNPGEGFNLRRDVYMRVANTVRQLRERGGASSD